MHHPIIILLYLHFNFLSSCNPPPPFIIQVHHPLSEYFILYILYFIVVFLSASFALYIAGVSSIGH